MTRALVCGWFTVDGGEATAGDLLAMEDVRSILAAADVEVRVVTNSGFPDGTRLDDVDPADVDCLVFVCGPLHSDRVARMVDRFPAARKVAVNVSVVDEAMAGRFDVVLARDGAGPTLPDLTFRQDPPALPVIGVVRAHPQPEYPGARHARADDAIRLLLAGHPCAAVDFDTRVHPSADPLQAHGRSPAEITSLAGRMDAVVSTRLHGMVLALGQGVPVLAIDPIAGGAKVTAQAAALDWPCRFTVDDLAAVALDAAQVRIGALTESTAPDVGEPDRPGSRSLSSQPSSRWWPAPRCNLGAGAVRR